MGLDDLDFDGLDDKSERTSGGFKTKPEGVYRAIVTGVEHPVITKAGDGEMMVVDLTVLGEGWTRKDFIITSHPKAVAQRIGLARMKSLAMAVAYPGFEETGKLAHGTTPFTTVPVKFFLSRKKAKKDRDMEYADEDGYLNNIEEYIADDTVAPDESAALTADPVASPTAAKKEGEIPF